LDTSHTPSPDHQLDEHRMLIDDARTQARMVLQQNDGPLGFRAARDGYPEVWARDAIISSIGCCGIMELTRRPLLLEHMHA
jgi:hypothetical protein